MEAILALVVGILGGAGVWLVLRPRTFQVIRGSPPAVVRRQPVHLVSMGSIFIDKPPILLPGLALIRALHGPDAAGTRAHGHRHRLPQPRRSFSWCCWLCVA